MKHKILLLGALMGHLHAPGKKGTDVNKQEMIEKISQAIATMEGFYKPDSLSEQQLNPGNIRQWSAQGRPYPRRRGYVDFREWAMKKLEAEKGGTLSPAEIRSKGEAEGWRVLRALVGQYLEGRYTNNRSPSLYEMFGLYAPDRDGNHSRRYAEFVGSRMGIAPDRMLMSFVEEGAKETKEEGGASGGSPASLVPLVPPALSRILAEALWGWMNQPVAASAVREEDIFSRNTTFRDLETALARWWEDLPLLPEEKKRLEDAIRNSRGNPGV